MSINVSTRAWKSSEKANRKLALLALAEAANDDGWAWPSQETLAGMVGIGRRAIQKILDALDAAGEIVIYQRRMGQSHRNSNVYHLLKYRHTEGAAPEEVRAGLKRRPPVGTVKKSNKVERRFAKKVNSDSHSEMPKVNSDSHYIRNSDSHSQCESGFAQNANQRSDFNANRDSQEPSVNEPSLKEQEQQQPETARPNIFKLLEDLAGTIPSMLVDDLKDAEKEFSADWLTDAFKEAAECNGRSWKYVRAILSRWQREGKPNAAPAPQPPAPSPTKPPPVPVDHVFPPLPEWAKGNKLVWSRS